MEAVVDTQVMPVLKASTVRHVQIADKLHAVEVIETLSTMDGVEISARPIRSPEILDTKSLKKALKRDFDYERWHPFAKDIKFHPFVFVITDEGRELVRTEGNPLGNAKAWEKLDKSGFLLYGYGELEKSLVDVCAANPGGVVFASNWDNSLVDVSGKPLPQAQVFDYMSGHLSDFHWDLKKLVEIAGTNPELELLTENDRPAGEKPVFPVPYYNRGSSNGSSQVRLKWTPSRETWDALLAKLPEGATSISNLMLDDILGKYDHFGFVAQGCKMPDRSYLEDSISDEDDD